MKEGWETKTLEDVCTFENGDRGVNYPSKRFRTATGIPFINAGHFLNNEIDFTDMNYISREHYEKMGIGKIQKGDILFCLRGSLGKFASVGDLTEGQIASSLVIVRPSDKVLHKYLIAYFQSELCIENIERFRNGAAQPNLSAQSLRKFTIPIPPLPEQQRIVRILDEAFDGIATARPNAERNLENARELFESELEAVFESSSQRWESRNLGDICEIGDGNHGENYPKAGDLRASGVPFIRSVNLVNGRISNVDMRYISEEKHSSLKKGHLKTGDVLFTNRGEIGKSAVVDSSFNDANLNSQIAYFRCSNLIFSWYLYYILQSPTIQSYVHSSQTGTALQQFTVRQIVSLKIPLPPIADQHRLVQGIDSLWEETQRLESIYEKKLDALDELKKALLHQAFRGEL